MKIEYDTTLIFKIYKTPTVKPKFTVALNDTIIFNNDANLLNDDILELKCAAQLGSNTLLLTMFDKDHNDLIIENGEIKFNIAVQLTSIEFNQTKFENHKIFETFGSHGFIGDNGQYVLNFIAPAFLYIRNSNLIS